MSDDPSWVLGLIDKAEVSLWELDVASSVVRHHGRLWARYGPAFVDNRIPLDSFEPRIHPDDVAGVHASLEATIMGRQALHRSEFRVQTPTGDWRWVEGVGRLERAPDGSPLRIVGSVVDIHDHRILREQTEKALRESEERFRSFLANTADAVWCFEPPEPIPTSLPVEEQFDRLLEARLAECNLTYGCRPHPDVRARRFFSGLGVRSMTLAST